MRMNNATPKDDAIRLAADKHTPKKTPNKYETALLHFVNRGCNGMTRREADKLYYDTCLNTTVSQLQMRFGLTIERKPSTKTNAYGGKPFYKYWIAPGKELNRARQVLEQLAAKREAT